MKRGYDSLVPTGSSSKRSKDALVEIPRTSSLSSPIVKLTGHSGGVHSCKFNHDGTTLASAGANKEIFLWNVFGDTDNYGTLSGHRHTVQDCVWSHDSAYLASCSADKSVKWWDSSTGTCIRSFVEHRSYVNGVDTSNSNSHLVASCGDDRNVKLWDANRTKKATHSFKHPFETTSVAFSSKLLNENLVFSGSVDGIVRAWDLRKEMALFQLQDRLSPSIVSGLSVVGNSLVSYHGDGQLLQWDTSFFVPGNRLKKKFIGATHNRDSLLIKCGASTSMVGVGASDHSLCIWNSDTPQEFTYRLPGHRGPVMDVDFHPSQSIVASCSLDKTVFLGELAL